MTTLQLVVCGTRGGRLRAPLLEKSTCADEQIAKEILEEAAATDRLEDERDGEKRGDELPPELSTERHDRH